jgi:alpha-beta hydrolase superfamily lysophospholipase
VNKCDKWLTPLLDQYKELGVKNITYKVYPDVRHETLNDMSREEVIVDIISFFEENI